MICKRCKTAGPDDFKTCPYCGSKLYPGGVAAMAMQMVIIISIIMLSSLFFYFQPNVFENDLVNASIDDNQPDGAESAEYTQTPDVKPSTVKVPNINPDPKLDNDLDGVYGILSGIYDAADQYYNKTSDEAEYVCRKGFLYDLMADKYIIPEDLISVGVNTDDYDIGNIFIMYIVPNDLKAYPEVKYADFVKNNENSKKNSWTPAIFAACETNDGIAMLSDGRKCLIYRENFNSLVEKYFYEHGEIRRPSSNEMEYRSVVDTVLSYDSISKSVFVRYLAVDDKYAVLAISRKDSNKLSGYVLQAVENGYSVIFNNFENNPLYKTDINGSIPDLNLELLPQYNLFEVNKLSPNLYFGLLTQKLVAEKVIQWDENYHDELVYISGNEKFGYMVYTSGTIVLAVNTGLDWTYILPRKWSDAETKIKGSESLQAGSQSSVYIIWQN